MTTGVKVAEKTIWGETLVTAHLQAVYRAWPPAVLEGLTSSLTPAKTTNPGWGLISALCPHLTQNQLSQYPLTHHSLGASMWGASRYPRLQALN